MLADTSTTQLKVFGVIGVLLTLGGGVFIGAWESLFDYVLNKQLTLSPKSYSYDLWEEIPIPLYFEFYLFNWTNPEDINHPTAHIRRPKLVEMGPYVYRETREKLVLKWNKENKTVDYYQKRTFHFEPEMSKGSLDDLVTTLNVPAVAAAFAIRNLSHLKYPLGLAMRALNTRLSVTRKVRELLFDGYEDPLMDLGNILPDEVLPVTIPFDKFGWFYTRNNSATYEGVFTMYTGEGDINQFGKISEWNYENPTSKFESHCGILNGSAGEFFPPNPEKGGEVSLFHPDLCRTLVLKYKEETVVDEIKGYRYWGDETMMDNLTKKPDTWCFCPSGECPPHGLIDVSTCKWNTPAFVSFPHFFNADPYYREAVSGMKPNENKHKMFIDLEKRSGIPLQVEAAVQINMLLQPYKEYDIFRHVPKIYFPCFWFKERAKMDGDIGSKVKLLTQVPTLGYIIFSAMACMGVLILVIVAIYYFNFRRKQ